MLREIFFMILDFIRKIIEKIFQAAPPIIEILKKAVILIAKIACAIAPIVWRMAKVIALSVIHIVRTIVGVVNQQSKSQ